ncbi:MAG: rRNA pseudouridine synthase [FCB group bacterium]|nr:rRNA pseudouridine synthase [FCB group bacterium]
MRLNKFLAQAGLASRRKCDDLIQEGLIKVNGKVTRDFSTDIGPDDIVQYKNRVLETSAEKVVYLLNKPEGVVSTSADPHNRRTVLDLLPQTERLFTVGRLDRDTTGALLITNDGDLAYKLTHPKFRVRKVYQVMSTSDIPAEKINQFPGGIRLEDGSLSRGKIRLLKHENGRYIWEVILTEGKNREIKRLFTALGSRVKKLHRVSFAGISADNLKPGKYRKLSKKELKLLLI